MLCDEKLNKTTKILSFLFSPFSIIPVCIILTKFFGNYSGYDIGHLQNIPLILQGSSDWGGSNMFAVYVASYVTFGIIASIYLNLRLWLLEYYEITIKQSLLIMRYYIIIFIILGTLFLRESPSPNDFRNVFFMMILIYSSCIIWITFLNKKNILKRYILLILSPLPIYIFIYIGWTGITTKAGQILTGGQIPLINPLSFRHLLMIRWHQFFDSFFNTVFPNNYFFYFLSVWLGIIFTFYLIFSFARLLTSYLMEKHKLLRSKYLKVLVFSTFTITSIGYILFHYNLYSKTIETANIIAERIKNEITMNDILLIKQDPELKSQNANFFKNQMLLPTSYSIINKILNKKNDFPNYSIRFLIPLNDQNFFFFCNHTGFKYADVRRLKNKYSHMNDYEIINNILITKKTYSKPFVILKNLLTFKLKRKKLLLGNIIFNDSKEMIAIIIIDYKYNPKNHLIKRM